MMEIKVILSNENTLIIDVENEDISVPEIIRREILKDGHVTFAGVTEQHPLLKKLTMRVQTKGVEPLDALISGCSKAIEKASDLLLEVKNTLTKEGT